MPITPYKRPVSAAVVIGVLISAAVLSALGYGFYRSATNPRTPPPDSFGCATFTGDFLDEDGKPVAAENVIILIDATDPVPPTVQNATISALERALTRSPPYSRVRVFSLAATVPAQLSPVAEACNAPPKHAADAIFAPDDDPYSEYRRHPDITTKVREILRGARIEPQSPILEMLSALSKQAVPDNRRRPRLIIVSDLLQKSSVKLDAYSRELRLEDVIAGNRWDRVPNLGGVTVEVIQIVDRSEDPDGTRARGAERFWRRVFDEANAQDVRFTQLGLVGDHGG